MNGAAPYRDRRHAGQELARALGARPRDDARILALPRGGVPVGLEIARALRMALDVFLVRKLGVPAHPELAMGAIASGDVQVFNQDVIASWGVTEEAIAAVVARERAELHRREVNYRRGRPPLAMAGAAVILVDDGLATGASMRAAVAAAQRLGAAHITVAVPVGARETCDLIAAEADLVCPLCVEEFYAVGAWYRDFKPTTDDEVRTCLDAAADIAGRRTDRHDILAE